MNEVSRILRDISQGDEKASEQLLPFIYEELRRLARAKMAQEVVGHTLTPTALVHEAYLRLVGPGDAQKWDGRGHFFAAAAEAMRRILVENARKKGRQRRGGDRQRVDLEEVHLSISAPVEELLQIDEALERLGAEDHVAAQLVKLRYFVGLSVEESAESLGMSRATAYRHWTYARAWLRCEVQGTDRTPNE